MKSFFFSLFVMLIFLVPVCLEGQMEGKTIKVKVDNYAEDTILLAYFYGDRQYVADTAGKNTQGQFVFEADSTWKTGLYLIVLPPDNRYIQFILSDREADLSIRMDANDLSSRPEFSKSKENKLFWDYLEFLEDKNSEARSLKEALANAPALGPEKSTYEKKLVVLDEEVKSYQRNLVLNEKQSLAAAIVKANIEVEIPEFSGTKEEADKARFQYYRDHYFDNLDLSDERLLRTPVLFDRVDRYINKYTVQVPDSIIASLDLVLTNAFPSEETYKFLLIHYLNEYAKSKFVGMDAMYVHLVDNYYANGKAPWVEKEQLDKIVKNANELRPLLIGKIAPNITVYKEDLTPVSLHAVESPFTVLFFWAPDCGHCQKSMPALVDFYKEYKAKGVEILAVCTKLLEKEGTCWDAVKEKNMESWINTSDKYLRSKFGQVYNVKSTPQVYVLDHKKEILTKQVAVEKLGEIMDLIFAEAESNNQ